MHDIRFIRENPKAFDEALKRRSYPLPESGGSWSDVILSYDADVRAAVAKSRMRKQHAISLPS